MEAIAQSVRPITRLRELYPGKWRVAGGAHWKGEKFDVRKDKQGKFYRVDTGEYLPLFPKIKKRSHFIHTLLGRIFGGEWVRCEDNMSWESDDHDFYVYRSGENRTKKMVYRRSDTKEIVYRPNGRKFY